MKSAKLYRLEVAPLIVLPLNRAPFFSYLSFSQIAAGSYVSIPFGKRVIQGVVFDCSPLPGKAPAWMKFVNQTIEEKFLTQKQLELAKYISEEYFTPLGKTLKHFLPRRAKARKNGRKLVLPAIKKLRALKTETDILKSFAASPKNSTLFMDASAIAEPHRILAHLAKKIFFQKQQALFLVPETTLLPELEASFSRYFSPEKIVTLSSQLSPGQYFEIWEKIRRGEAGIILSTRQGLFAPFKNLGLVALLEEQDESYKQWDMSPRYHSKRVAEYLAMLHNAKFLLVSGTPSWETRYHLQKKHCVPLVPLSSVSAFGRSVEIVNLRLERFKKNYSPFSQTLIDAIRETLGKKKQILIYIHRQGMNAFSVCENCKNVFRCPKSGHTLTGTKDGSFRCLSCGYKTGSFPNCPQCGHLSFRHIGLGAEKVEKEALKIFPSARVLRADGSTIRTLQDARRLYEKVSSDGVDILIGTQMILKGPTLPKLALIGMIDADSLLALPDFRSDEKLFHILERAVKQSRVILQTFHPENAFFQKISHLDSQEFSEQMLTERESLFYPPFSRLISIVCQEKTQEKSEETVQALYKSLKKLFPKGDIRYRLSSPQPIRSKFTQKIFRNSLLLRIPSEKPLAENIRMFLQKNSALCVIDVDPISFF